MNIIQKNQRIWTCQQCYTSYHIHCIQKWSNEKIIWQCPICTQEYYNQPKPTCFCGKHSDGSMFEMPHCCGEICGKKRGKLWGQGQIQQGCGFLDSRYFRLIQGRVSQKDETSKTAKIKSG